MRSYLTVLAASLLLSSGCSDTITDVEPSTMILVSLHGQYASMDSAEVLLDDRPIGTAYAFRFATAIVEPGIYTISARSKANPGLVWDAHEVHVSAYGQKVYDTLQCNSAGIYFAGYKCSDTAYAHIDGFSATLPVWPNSYMASGFSVPPGKWSYRVTFRHNNDTVRGETIFLKYGESQLVEVCK